jgi:hypothetical protein
MFINVGTITLDVRQSFRQYDTFDQYSFISHLELKSKFQKTDSVSRLGTTALSFQ